MPKLFNHDHQAQVVDPDLPAVAPGESHEFTAAQVQAGIAGLWKDDAPEPHQAPEPDPEPSSEEESAEQDSPRPPRAPRGGRRRRDQDTTQQASEEAPESDAVDRKD